jgi:1-acyl-sn-glycerol-3-phosphate acyltransferase
MFVNTLKTDLPQTSVLTRCARLLRLGLHFLTGFAILTFRYPHMTRDTRSEITRAWSRHFLATLALDLRTSGHIPSRAQAENTLLVSNHVSWLDIIALASCTPPRFVAKQEIRRWPIVGWMTHRGGTLFIDRSNRRDASRVNQVMAQALREGDCLCVFPEGTTTTGHHLLPFKSSLFESAVLAGSTVIPVTLRYVDEAGHITSAPAYAGETTFWQSLSRLLRLRRVTVEVHYGAPLVAGREPLLTRFELAEAARHDISTQLSLLPGRPDTAMQTADDPQAEAQ